MSVRSKMRRREHDPRVQKLCRLLGFGLLGVSNGRCVEIFVEPARWRPRSNPKRRSRLIQEYHRQQGHPALGGSTRGPIMTAYRREAVACGGMAAERRCVRELKATSPDAPKNPAQKCLWLVLANSARCLRLDGRRTGYLGPMADNGQRDGPKAVCGLAFVKIPRGTSQ